MNTEAYRFEYKYLIGAASAELIKRRLDALIDRDPHATSTGDYFIRSVYFDDDALSSYYDKLAGVSTRNKYRLRFYNMDSGRIALEAKRKRDRLVQKDSAPVSLETAEKMLSCIPLLPEETSAPVLREFAALCAGGGMRPSVIVDYVRTAFVYPVGDVRITLDSDLRSESFRHENVFARYAGVPVLEDGDVILEVKYTDWLPPHLGQLLEDVPKILCANSKYCNCLAVYL